MIRILLVAMIAFGNVGGAVLFTDNFDAGPFGLNTDPANWMTTDGTVDTLTNGSFGLSCRGGSAGCVDLDGSTGNAGRLESNMMFNLTAGTMYTLQYYLAGSQRGDSNTVDVQFGSATQTHTLPTSQSYTLFTLMFTPVSNTSTRIVFDHSGGDNLGLLLDDVTLSDSARAVVPEPSSFMLLGGGIAAMMLARRRPRS